MFYSVSKKNGTAKIKKLPFHGGERRKKCPPEKKIYICPNSILDNLHWGLWVEYWK